VHGDLDNAFNKGGGNQMQQSFNRCITCSVSTGWLKSFNFDASILFYGSPWTLQLSFYDFFLLLAIIFLHQQSNAWYGHSTEVAIVLFVT